MRNFFNKCKKIAQKASEKINSAINWCVENIDVVVRVVVAHIICFEKGFMGI